MEHDGCKGCKYEHCSPESKECQGCKRNAVDKYTRMTNADRIRSMSDEELAEFLDIVEQDGIQSQYSGVPCNCCTEKTECDSCWKSWLQSEVGE